MKLIGAQWDRFCTINTKINETQRFNKKNISIKILSIMNELEWAEGLRLFGGEMQIVFSFLCFKAVISHWNGNSGKHQELRGINSDYSFCSKLKRNQMWLWMRLDNYLLKKKKKHCINSHFFLLHIKHCFIWFSYYFKIELYR